MAFNNLFLVHDFLEASAQECPNKIALICGKDRLSYGQINRLANALANNLFKWGLRKQDRVIIFLENSAEAVISLYGVLKTGGIFVILNPSIKAKKLRYIIQDAEASFIITQKQKEEVVKEALVGLEKTCKVIAVENNNSFKGMPIQIFTWEEAIKGGENEQHLPEVIDVDLATLIYTSGSTGEPKGVMSTHANMVAAAKSIIRYLKLTPQEIILNVLPLSFDYGLYQLLMAFMVGATLVLEKSFLYPIKILEVIEREKVTGFPVVPTVISLLLGLKNLDKFNLRSLRYMTNTAAALPVEHIRRIREIFPWIEFYSMYGLTECKRVSFLDPKELDKRPGSVGKAIPNCEVFIVDEEGNELGPGEIGELVVRGSNVMQGYWKAPELTEKTFRQGRYPGERLLYTGDLFKKDNEGFLYFVGRKDDLIKTRGERVSPREVENVLCGMPGVLEAAVVGIPDEILGQAIKAFVVCKPGNSISEKEIRKYCADNLEIFMRPKYIEILSELPRTPNGKIDKTALKNYTS